MSVNNQKLGQNKPFYAYKKKSKPKTYIQVAIENPKSRKYAIFSNCWTCVGGIDEIGENKGVRSDIKNCEILNCSLHAYRPFQNKKSAVRFEPARTFDSSSRNHEVKNK